MNLSEDELLALVIKYDEAKCPVCGASGKGALTVAKEIADIPSYNRDENVLLQMNPPQITQAYMVVCNNCDHIEFLRRKQG